MQFGVQARPSGPLQQPRPRLVREGGGGPRGRPGPPPRPVHSRVLLEWDPPSVRLAGMAIAAARTVRLLGIPRNLLQSYPVWGLTLRHSSCHAWAALSVMFVGSRPVGS